LSHEIVKTGLNHVKQNKNEIKKEKIIEAMKECSILRLNTNKALELIRKLTGKKISERTYRRYKKEMEDGINSRYGDMIKSEFILEHVQRVDTLKKVEREYWRNYNSTDSVPTRKAILDSIRTLQYMFTEYYHGEEIIKRLARWMDDGLKKIEKHQEMNKQLPFTDYTKTSN